MKNVVLIGFMGAGKSTIGRALARKIGVPFLDTDRELRQEFGMTISEVFAQHGEAAFREAETGLLQALVEESTQAGLCDRRYPRSYVLSTGGGAPLSSVNRPLLRGIGQVVWLRAKPETIASRCRPHLERRPLLRDHSEDLVEHIAALLAQREAHYLETAHCAVWADDEQYPDRIVSQIKSILH